MSSAVGSRKKAKDISIHFCLPTLPEDFVPQTRITLPAGIFLTLFPQELYRVAELFL